jgi:type I restriction enzyme S subunit
MSEWSIACLGDIADIRFSNVDKKDGHGEVPIRLCNYLDVYDNDYITADLPFMEASATRAEIDRLRVEKGDVMVTKDSETPEDIGIPAVVVDEIDALVCGYHLALIKPDRKKVDSVYLAKQLACKPTSTYFSRLANGSTRYGLSSSAIASTPVWLAPLRHQRRIAEILSTLDETIEQTEALIAKYQQIKAGLMHDLFTRGVTPDGKLRPTRAEAPQLYKESSLGWIPKEWEVITAGQTCQLITKGTTPAQFLEKEESWSVPYIRVQNLSFDGSLAFEEDRAFIPAVVSRGELARSRVLPNDILMNIVGPPLGKVSVVPNEYPEWNVNQAIAIFRTKVRESTYYLSFYLLSNIAQSWFLSRAKRTSGQVNLTLEMCRDLPISFPLKSNEQITITEGLANADDQIRSETLILKKLRQQKHGLMHDLLTGHVRVKVAESEPAQM